jgi:hypothetical protein
MAEKERKRFYPSVTSIDKSHRDYSRGSSHHVFSFCDDDDTAIQDLLDLSRRQFPNFVHDQYLYSAPFFYIQGICTLDLAQVDNQQVPEVGCISLCQNLKGFQWLDHLQIVANFHQQPSVVQPKRESHRIQQVVQDFLQAPTKLEDLLQR